MARIFFRTLKNRLIKDTYYATINLRVFHNSVSVFIPLGRRDRAAAIETRRSRLPEGIGPISVVGEHPLPNRSGSGDPDLQG